MVRGEVAQSVPRVVLRGAPRAGKSTVVQQLLGKIGDLPVQGFWTREVRSGGDRVGFMTDSIQGDSAWISHVDFPEPRVGRYGVDVAAIERVALPALARVTAGDVVLVDELGRAQMLSARLVDAVERVLRLPCPAVVTVHVFGHPVTDRLTSRPDVHVIDVTPENRDQLPGMLSDLLRGAVGV